MNTVTVLEPKVGIDAKTQEKVVKLLAKQLKRVQKHTGFRTYLQQIHSYEDKAVFTDNTICEYCLLTLQISISPLILLLKNRLRMGNKLLILKQYHTQKQTTFSIQKIN